MNKYDVIIIGAGPSGIFCAYELMRQKPDMKVLMIEKGRSIEKRQCPKRTTKVCVGCKPCSITTGFAGAGAFSDGKLSLSPDVGGTLPEILGYEKAEELITPIVEANGFELVDVEYVKEGGTWYLRAYIDKEGGITVDDCEIVSRAFSDRLDAEDFIDDAYIMEVSSPGLGRPLKKEKDYKRSMGKELEIRTYRAIERNREFYGILTAYDDNSVTILEEDGTERVFQKSDIALIRLAFDF